VPFTLEISEPWPDPEPGTLATMAYPPTETEPPFVERAFAEDPLGMTTSTGLSRTEYTFGGWFGIVRGHRLVPERNETRLLLESKRRCPGSCAAWTGSPRRRSLGPLPTPRPTADAGGRTAPSPHLEHQFVRDQGGAVLAAQ
jgi:hypothetical protein